MLLQLCVPTSLSPPPPLPRQNALGLCLNHLHQHTALHLSLLLTRRLLSHWLLSTSLSISTTLTHMPAFSGPQCSGCWMHSLNTTLIFSWLVANPGNMCFSDSLNPVCLTLQPWNMQCLRKWPHIMATASPQLPPLLLWLSAHTFMIPLWALSAHISGHVAPHCLMTPLLPL